MFYSNLLRFKLIQNSKNPTSEWSITNRKEFFRIPKEDEIKKYTNWGIVTGKSNDITVIDLDVYKNGFEFPFEYMSINTPIIKTPNGGYHIYFKYDSEFRNTQLKSEMVDIRNDGGYIVCPKSIVDGKKYTIVRDCEISKMPEDIKIWLLDRLKQQSYKPVRNKKVNKNVDIKKYQNLYEYNIPLDELKKVFELLPNNYWANYSDFLIFTTACKILNCYDLWDELNRDKPKYDKTNNDKIWNGCDISQHYTVNKILGKDSILLDYYKYKPILKNVYKANKEINKHKLGYDFFDNKTSYVVKSDTGTGKTTSFKTYIKETKQPFISIVSRITLGDEQSIVFSESGLDVRFYKRVKNFINGQNIVIQLDSIMKLTNIDFKDYVIFLDEYNSIIDHLITSSTLSQSRTSIYTLFTRILKECKQIIATDADITDISLDYLNSINKDYQYITNIYLHNKGIEASELFNYVDFINEVKKHNKYMICADSKDVADSLKKDLDDESIYMITGDTEKYSKLDEHDKIIFSPKLIYGADSIMTRPVFCYYKEHTINPNSFLQQIARCRNITKLTYLFNKKTFQPNEETYEMISNRIINDDLAGCALFKLMCDEKTNNDYLDLLKKYEYNNVSYRTNKFAHFIKLLDDRGFVRVNKIYKKEKGNLKEILKEFKQYKIDTFNQNDNYVKKINEILRIPSEKIEEYKNIFICRDKLDNHFTYCSYLKNNNMSLTSKLGELNEFNCNKIKSNKMKLLYLYVLKDKLGCPDLNDITITKDLDKLDSKLMYDMYNILFRNRKKDDFSKREYCLKYMIEIYKRLFGDNLIKSCTRGKNKIKVYSFNEEIIKYHKTLQEYRKPPIEFDETDEIQL